VAALRLAVEAGGQRRKRGVAEDQRPGEPLGASAALPRIVDAVQRSVAGRFYESVYEDSRGLQTAANDALGVPLHRRS
jgi:hypothetical protein